MNNKEKNLGGVAAGSPLPAHDQNFVVRVLGLFADHDIHDALWWKRSGDGLRFFVNVNDVFFWGSADCEEVTAANVAELERAVSDCEAVDPDAAMEGCELFAARLRKSRPQGASYPANPALWPLFDACGPEREKGLGNPYRPGEYKPRQIANVPA